MKTHSEILYKHLINTDWGDANDLKREMDENKDQVDAIIRAMSEVEQQTREEMFEFAEWMQDEGVEKLYDLKKDSTYWVVYNYDHNETDMIFDTIQELFDYWKQLQTKK
jgi:hypothetical protein